MLITKIPVIAAFAVVKFVRYLSIPIWMNFGPSNWEIVASKVNAKFNANVRLYGRT